ncbi:hypothetical protein PHYBOEH_012083 [Phytophthora boehmeriae]|uniref:PX domain-containing protein n=1 Tax=Phytophthora boehmeriae TaxID=109152 RepID=A0A8T1WXB0_9STRA|nr:hypothetical protein PHYBOEH_012083 [Phytophthora boehmeriae]
MQLHLDRINSKVPMPRLNPYAPTLSPVTTVPQDASWSMDFLTNIDQIRIIDTQPSVQDGTTLYVVELYSLCPSTSNIPTVRNNGSRGDTTVQTPATATSSSSSEQSTPERHLDLCVRRRFTDFAHLRHEALAVTCVNARFLCKYCCQFQTYARFHAAQPFWFVRVATTKKQKKKILVRFLADLVDFAQSRVQRSRHCRLRQTLPMLLEKFLND